MDTMPILWQALQVCGDCGRGYFRDTNGFALCDHCGHEHPMDPWNLAEGERFTFTEHGLLSVVAHDVTVGGVSDDAAR